VRLYLADTSVWAWARRRDDLNEKLAARMHDGTIAVCVPIALELLHNARDGSEYEEVLRETLGPATWLPTSDASARTALDLQRQLAVTTHGAHRLPSIDYLVVGVAEAAEATLWHVDRHLHRLCVLAGIGDEHEQIG
jgi:predicted nucleic acid-binding protein